MSLREIMGWLVLPEILGGMILCVIFAACARFGAGKTRDAAKLEMMVTLLPFAVVILIFGAFFVWGAQSWWLLGRATVVAVAVLILGSIRLVLSFGPGPAGQDAMFILAVSIGMILLTLVVPVGGAVVLAEVRPGFGDWFRRRWFLGSLLTMLSAVPVGAVFLSLGYGLAMAAAVVAGIAQGLRAGRRGGP